MSDTKQAQIENQKNLTVVILKSQFVYEPETGIFRRVRNGGRADWPNDSNDNCYRKVWVWTNGKRKNMFAHRLAWLYMTGSWPKEEIDHIDMCKGNNAWANLREASHSSNVFNIKMRLSNKSGYRGVFFRKDMNKWTASIGFNGQRIYLGAFDNIEEAKNAYQQKAIELHKEFANITCK